MKILLLALIIAILFWGFSLPFIIRAIARRSSDRIFYGQQPSTEKRINSCISFLTWSNNWLTNNTREDQKRIDRLKAKLYGMQHPHG